VVKKSRTSTSGIVSRQEKDQYWSRILIIDDDPDITTTFKVGIEDANKTSNKKIAVDTFNDPRKALLDFKPNFYDLLLVDINMPYMNGFHLAERILGIDINVKICYMSSGEINRDALREVHPSISLGCFMKKPVEIDYLIGRVIAELD
jgi:DNA-binding response OmpR family regulator